MDCVCRIGDSGIDGFEHLLRRGLRGRNQTRYHGADPRASIVLVVRLLHEEDWTLSRSR